MYESVMKITRMRDKALPDGRPIESQCSTTVLTLFYRTVCVANRLELRSVTCDNAQLPMLSEPCSCWPVAASVGSGH